MSLALLKRNLSSELTDRLPSPNIWGGVPIEQILMRTKLGTYFHDDFDVHCPNTDAGLFEGAGESPGMGYGFYGDTGVIAKAQAGVVGGVLEVYENDADNDEFVMSGLAPSFNISDTAADAMPVCFEGRMKKASIADNELAFFLGLAWDHGDGVSVAKTLCLTDDDAALGAFSYIGFHCDAADGDAIDFVVKAEGGAQTVIKAGIEVPVADTWMKLGFKYDPDHDTTKRIKLFVNNVEQSTYVTSTQIAAATFPDAEPLAPVWCVKTCEASPPAAGNKAQIDWWRAATWGK